MKMLTGTHRSNNTLRSLCARVNVNGRSGCPCRTFLRKINSAHLLFFVLLFLLYEHVLIFSSWEEKSKWSYTYSHFEETCLHKNQILLCVCCGQSSDWSSSCIWWEWQVMDPFEPIYLVKRWWQSQYGCNLCRLYDVSCCGGDSHLGRSLLTWETGRVSLNDYGMSAEERQEQSCLSSTMKNILYLQYSK